jgi:hypothetical protein
MCPGPGPGHAALIPFLLSLLTLAQAAAPPPPAPPKPAPQNAAPAAPQTVSPAPPTVQPSPDPASAHFSAAAGLLLVAIKPAAAADYEEVIRALQEALAKDTDATRVAAAKGWQVYKAVETDAKGNVLYIHVMLPAVAGFDYRPSLLLDQLVDDLAPELLSKYQEAFAMPPSRLNLTELATMSVAPLPKPAPTPAPETKKPPGGR